MTVSRTVLIEHYAIDYELTFAGTGWTVWEQREDGECEVASFEAMLDAPADELIQLGTDAIDAAARALTAGAEVLVGHQSGHIVEVNGEVLVEFEDGDFMWFPAVRVRAR